MHLQSINGVTLSGQNPHPFSVRAIARVWRIINLNTLVVITLSFVATYISIAFDLRAELPLTIISITVIFPMVFSINSAYQRRERALDAYGQLQAYLSAVLLGLRDWRSDTEHDLALHKQGLALSEAVLNDMSAYLSCQEQGARPTFNQDSFIALSRFINHEGRQSGIVPPEISRLNHFLALMMDAANTLRLIKDYRTPVTLKAFSTFFVFVLPVMYAPHFAGLAENYTKGLVYILPLLFSLVLVSLSNIQDELEDPFDNIGEDDITINTQEILHDFR